MPKVSNPVSSQDSYLVGLIGSGIGPSLSPALHEREADRQGLRYVYRLIDIDDLGVGPEAVGDLVRAARDLGFDGLNITHPCKQLVIEHLDGLAPQAAALGAVNTVVFEDGRAVGHNTDVTGFAASFARGLPDAPLEKVVQLGAGGAGAAVAHAMLTLGAEHSPSSTRCPTGRPTSPPPSTGTSARGGPPRRRRTRCRRCWGRPTGSSTRRRRGWPRTPGCRSPPSRCIPGCGWRRWCTGPWRRSCCGPPGISAAPRWTGRDGGVPGGRRVPPVHRAGAGRFADAGRHRRVGRGCRGWSLSVVGARPVAQFPAPLVGLGKS